MNSTKKCYLEYINESFDDEDLELGIPVDGTPGERARAFLKLVKDSLGSDSLSSIKDYLQGLGRGLDIDYMNCDILYRAREFGLILSMLNNSKYSKYKDQEKALDKIEEQILENYWDVMALYIFQMSSKN